MWGDNQFRGKLAKAQGLQFEKILEFNAKCQDILFVRMPDGCKTVSRTRIIRVRTPFDYVLVYNGISVFIDCKSFDSDRITHSQLVDHQIDSLKQINEKGCTSGYLVWFRKENAVCFAPISRLSRLTPGQSLHGSETIYLGSIEEFYLGRLFSYHLEHDPYTDDTKDRMVGTSLG